LISPLTTLAGFGSVAAAWSASQYGLELAPDRRDEGRGRGHTRSHGTMPVPRASGPQYRGAFAVRQ
jgi:hypothetical protein